MSVSDSQYSFAHPLLDVTAGYRSQYGIRNERKSTDCIVDFPLQFKLRGVHSTITELN